MKCILSNNQCKIPRKCNILQYFIWDWYWVSLKFVDAVMKGVRGINLMKNIKKTLMQWLGCCLIFAWIFWWLWSVQFTLKLRIWWNSSKIKKKMQNMRHFLWNKSLPEYAKIFLHFFLNGQSEKVQNHEI